MKKINTKPLAGMLELLPAAQRTFDDYKYGIAAAFARNGYLHIETPVIERMETLLAKAGGETEKQIYKVVKTAEDDSDADQALRFDHTVPLARYTAEHMNDLSFPFKVTQIARNYRGERSQKGRYREFYQCDADVIGWQKLPIAYDADVIRTLVEALGVFRLPSLVVRISNRKILAGAIEEMNLEQKTAEILHIIDKAEKVSEEKTAAALNELWIGEDYVSRIITMTKIRGTMEEVEPQLRKLGFSGEKFNEGISELAEVMRLLENTANVRYEADMLIVRGLDYYTGTVFETIVPEAKEMGSVCSGGRYENLAGNYTEQVLPGVGGSIGLTRLYSVLLEHGYASESIEKPIDTMIVPISENEYKFAEEVARDLRADGRKVDINYTDKKLGDKLALAAKIAKGAVVIGENEVASRSWQEKIFE